MSAGEPARGGRAAAPSRGDPDPLLRGALRTATGLTRRLGPRRHRLADAVGIGFWALQPAQRRRTAANHRRRDPSLVPAEAARLARASYREYARTCLDFVWAVDMAFEDVRRHASVEGIGQIHAHRAAGLGSIAALSHFGNWDMAANIAIANDVELTTVMASLGPGRVTDLVAWARERNHLEVYPPDRAVRGLLRALRQQRTVALLCDVPEAGPTVVVDFCGGRIAFSSVPAWLALRTGAPLLPTHCQREGDRYHAIIHGPVEVADGDDPQVIMQRVARVLEGAIARHPSQWYPFRDVWAADR